MKRKGDREAHIKTMFVQLRDAYRNKEKTEVIFTAGYYAALYNEGYMSELENDIMKRLFQTVELSLRSNHTSEVIKELLLSSIDQAEEILLKGGEK